MNNIVFTALGGLQEVGANCYIYGRKNSNDYIMVDLGIGFRDAKYQFLESFLPDISYVTTAPRRIQALLITHAHEDHIGAIPYLVEELKDVPIYATALTIKLIKQKLSFSRSSTKLKFIEVTPKAPFQVGDFTITYIPTLHSIPEANMLLMQTPYQNILHSGDFQIDTNTFKPAELQAMLPKDIEYFLCESTNAPKNKAYQAESTILPHLEEVIKGAQSTVWLTMFSSNIFRLNNVLKMAKECGRKVVLLGRSIKNYYSVARSLGYIEHSDFLGEKDLKSVNLSKVLFILTGSQGEHTSYLKKLLYNEIAIPQVNIKKGDTVVFLSKPIPGNEMSVYKLYNKIAERGAHLATADDYLLHVSGHAYGPELELAIRTVGPKRVIPIHGESWQLSTLADISRSVGIKADYFECGDLIELTSDGPKHLDTVPWGKLSHEGRRNVSLNSSVFKARRKCMFDGNVSVALLVKDNLISAVDFNILGLFTEEELEKHIPYLTERALAINNNIKGGSTKVEDAGAAVKTLLRKFVKEKLGKKPAIKASVFFV